MLSPRTSEVARPTSRHSASASTRGGNDHSAETGSRSPTGVGAGAAVGNLDRLSLAVSFAYLTASPRSTGVAVDSQSPMMAPPERTISAATATIGLLSTPVS